VERTKALAAEGLPFGMICEKLGVNHATAWRWRRDAEQDDDESGSLKVQFSKAISDAGAQLAKTQVQNLVFQAAEGSTQAATWLLTHHPSTRDHFSDAAAERRTERKTVAIVLEAVAAAGLPPELERTLLLHMQARGLGAAPQEGEA
jgi:transposase-like protein